MQQGFNTTTSAYDRADRITQVGTAAYTVDANGNLTHAGATSYGYDALNRLTSAAATYTYDGDGRRATQTASGATTTYVDDVAQAQPAVLTDQAGATSHSYVWGLGLAGIVDQTENVCAPHADGLGSVRALTDASQSVVESYLTDDFGVATQTQGTSAQRVQYTGQERDTEDGLVYLRARAYSPALGRFMSRDPLAGMTTLPLSLNRYLYALDNRVTGVDPSGLSSSRATQDPDCLNWSSSRTCALPGVDVSPDGVGISPTILKDPCQASGAFCATDEGAEGASSASRSDTPGAMRRLIYQPSPKHGPVRVGDIGKAPVHGQEALDVSVQVKPTSARRVGIDYATGEFVVFDQTSEGVFHGHVRSWHELTQEMRNTLVFWGMADRRGNILTGSE